MTSPSGEETFRMATRPWIICRQKPYLSRGTQHFPNYHQAFPAPSVEDSAFPLLVWWATSEPITQEWKQVILNANEKLVFCKLCTKTPRSSCVEQELFNTTQLFDTIQPNWSFRLILPWIKQWCSLTNLNTINSWWGFCLFQVLVFMSFIHLILYGK